MSDFLKNMALKTAINVIGIDTISSAVQSFMQLGITWANSQPLEADEKQVVGLLYDNAGEIYYAAVTVDSDSRILRYLVDQPLTELIATLINNLQNAS